jgi:parvulin-like peptidyl-prolyl isomerase
VPVRLFRRLAPLLAVLAIAATGCDYSSGNDAATVNGKSISVDTVQDELKEIQSNKAYRAAIESASGGYGVALAGSGKGTFNNEFTAQALSIRIYYSAIEQDLAERGIEVSAAEEKDAFDATKENLGQVGWSKFSTSYQQELAHQNALIAKAQEESASGLEPSQAQVACVSHILISTQGRTDAEAKAKAEDLKRQLDAGADFATLAEANSDDSSKDQGGDLGCQPEGAYVAEFEQAVQSAPLNQVTGPVKTDFGYHLILVKSREQQEVQPDQAASTQAFSDYLSKLLCKQTKVTVDPRYGTWDRSGCAAGVGLPKVSTPSKPAASGSK